jgi:CMP/dCMP kinase
MNSHDLEAGLPAAVTSAVLAVDGPSGSGKSSVSRGVAQRLGLSYLDTGAMYRAVTWWMLEHAIDVNDAETVASHASLLDLTISTDPTNPTIAVDGVDVSGPIRGPEVTGAVSAVSAVPAVRTRMVAIQRRVADAGGIVVEGRDIGTVVLPDATLKVFLTARPDVRSARRSEELRERGLATSLDPDDALRSLERRDYLDSTRAVSPLVRADDAIEVDATDLGLGEVIDVVVGLLLDRLRGADLRSQTLPAEGTADVSTP